MIARIERERKLANVLLDAAMEASESSRRVDTTRLRTSASPPCIPAETGAHATTETLACTPWEEFLAAL
ncbi:hypothetical protein EPN44_10960 [bacterium]|nr:MAG: hypothetical protein EPN44_10960 [bacterium]